MYTLFTIVCCIATLKTTAAYTSMQDFFPEVFQHGNLSEVTWDHAVNSKQLLTDALANDKHMIEADVLIGYLINSNPRELTVIMGHPPIIISDLSLEQFLNTVIAHNADPTKRKKGVKLDFKGSDAYAKAMSGGFLLNSDETAFREEFTKFPLWINGDIAKGPGENWNNGVDLQLAQMKSKPAVINAATWSLGWTTGNYQEGTTYTMEQINAMKTTVQGIANVTFPVRAMYAAKSREAMVALLDVGTLTIWSGKQDDEHVDVAQLAKLIADYLDKVYVDVPDTLWQRLRDAMH